MLQNWDDIVDLCAKDRATGHGAKTAMDIYEAMSRETNEPKFMGLSVIATIDLEEQALILKEKDNVQLLLAHILTRERLEKKKE